MSCERQCASTSRGYRLTECWPLWWKIASDDRWDASPSITGCTISAAKRRIRSRSPSSFGRAGAVLGIDGKAIYVRGAKHCLLIGVDHPTQDIVHALVLSAETAEGFARLERKGAAQPLIGSRRRAGGVLEALLADLRLTP